MIGGKVGMGRRRGAAMKPAIDRYQAMDAANTISRAREHLANPKMVKAIRQHINAMDAAVTGGLKPKGPSAKRG